MTETELLKPIDYQIHELTIVQCFCLLDRLDIAVNYLEYLQTISRTGVPNKKTPHEDIVISSSKQTIELINSKIRVFLSKLSLKK